MHLHHLLYDLKEHCQSDSFRTVCSYDVSVLFTAYYIAPVPPDASSAGTQTLLLLRATWIIIIIIAIILHNNTYLCMGEYYESSCHRSHINDTVALAPLILTWETYTCSKSCMYTWSLDLLTSRSGSECSNQVLCIWNTKVDTAINGIWLFTWSSWQVVTLAMHASSLHMKSQTMHCHAQIIIIVFMDKCLFIMWIMGASCKYE